MTRIKNGKYSESCTTSRIIQKKNKFAVPHASSSTSIAYSKQTKKNRMDKILGVLQCSIHVLEDIGRETAMKNATWLEHYIS